MKNITYKKLLFATATAALISAKAIASSDDELFGDFNINDSVKPQRVTTHLLPNDNKETNNPNLLSETEESTFRIPGPQRLGGQFNVADDDELDIDNNDDYDPNEFEGLVDDQYSSNYSIQPTNTYILHQYAKKQDVDLQIQTAQANTEQKLNTSIAEARNAASKCLTKQTQLDNRIKNHEEQIKTINEQIDTNTNKITNLDEQIQKMNETQEQKDESTYTITDPKSHQSMNLNAQQYLRYIQKITSKALYAHEINDRMHVYATALKQQRDTIQKNHPFQQQKPVQQQSQNQQDFQQELQSWKNELDVYQDSVCDQFPQLYRHNNTWYKQNIKRLQSRKKIEEIRQLIEKITNTATKNEAEQIITNRIEQIAIDAIRQQIQIENQLNDFQDKFQLYQIACEKKFEIIQKAFKQQNIAVEISLQKQEQGLPIIQPPATILTDDQVRAMNLPALDNGAYIYQSHNDKEINMRDENGLIYTAQIVTSDKRVSDDQQDDYIVIQATEQGKHFVITNIKQVKPEQKDHDNNNNSNEQQLPSQNLGESTITPHNETRVNNTGVSRPRIIPSQSDQSTQSTPGKVQNNPINPNHDSSNEDAKHPQSDTQPNIITPPTSQAPIEQHNGENNGIMSPLSSTQPGVSLRPQTKTESKSAENSNDNNAHIDVPTIIKTPPAQTPPSKGNKGLGNRPLQINLSLQEVMALIQRGQYIQLTDKSTGETVNFTTTNNDDPFQGAIQAITSDAQQITIYKTKEG